MANSPAVNARVNGCSLCIDDFNEVSLSCQSVSPQWSTLAKHLNVGVTIVENIEATRGGRDTVWCLDELLKEWLRQTSPDQPSPSRKILCNAISNIDRPLSEKILADHTRVCDQCRLGDVRSTPVATAVEQNNAPLAARKLSALFDELLDFTTSDIEHVDVSKLRLHISQFFKREEEINEEIDKHLMRIEAPDCPTSKAVLNYFVRHDFIGYINYSLIKIFQEIAKSPKLDKNVENYEKEYHSFLKLSLTEVHNVFQKYPDLKPKYPAGIPKFTIRLQSEWDGKSMFDLKEFLRKCFANSDCIDQLMIAEIIHNCFIMTFTVLPHIAKEVVGYLTNDDVIKSMKSKGISVDVSNEQLMKYKQEFKTTSMEQQTSGTLIEFIEADVTSQGKCLIINNTEKDQRIFQLLFASLNFEVDVHRNLTGDQMITVAIEYSRMNHTGAFVFFLSCHCEYHDLVYGTDGEFVPVSFIAEFFKPTRCPSLAGTPKIFIIDATSDKNMFTPFEELKADFTIFFASSPDKKAAYLAQNLKVAIDEADKDDDFHKILDEVKRKCKQQQLVALHTNTQQRKYYIKRNTLINTAQMCCRNFKNATQEWLVIRQMTIAKVENVIETLKHHPRVNSVHTAGGTPTIGGATTIRGATAIGAIGTSIAVMVGVGLAPMTFGGSLLLSAVAGGAVASFALAKLRTTEIQELKNRVTEAMECYERDQRKLTEAMEFAEEIHQCIEKTFWKSGHVQHVNLAVSFFAATLGFAYHGTNVGLKEPQVAFGRFLEVGALSLRTRRDTSARGVAIGGIASNTLLIPVDIGEMVEAATASIKRGDEYEPAVKQLQDFVNELKYQKSTIQEKF